MSSPKSATSEDIEDIRICVRIYYRRCCNKGLIQLLPPLVLADMYDTGHLEALGWADYTYEATACTNGEEAEQDIYDFGPLYALETFGRICGSCMRALRLSVRELEKVMEYDYSVSCATPSTRSSQENQEDESLTDLPETASPSACLARDRD
ncbi:hypothetical protein Slin15195_G024660 [Septoria linicola]|uniref:Uncharacterized protein n=1 Tax=Septoria linicola TaxID=215465 RepID=A0A9Q9AH90_9PEZI|nr:hypothetical protein Slin14017_G023750 [Septoria linicola]USW49147.1 hypothetical protein Slin15195_G024660 [Septoria linicola]